MENAFWKRGLVLNGLRVIVSGLRKLHGVLQHYAHMVLWVERAGPEELPCAGEHICI